MVLTSVYKQKIDLVAVEAEFDSGSSLSRPFDRTRSVAIEWQSAHCGRYIWDEQTVDNGLQDEAGRSSSFRAPISLPAAASALLIAPFWQWPHTPTSDMIT